MPHQELYNNLFARDAGSDNPKELLQQVTGEFPYFSVAHFFLLKETRSSEFNYKKIAARTALHFNNPFLLNYQLNRKLNISPEVIDVVDIVENKVEVEKVNKVEEVEPQINSKVNEPIAVLQMDKIEEVQKADIEIKNDIIEKANEPIIAPPVEIVEEIVKDNKNEELVFEPLHTTDYFASQGIKLSEEVQTGDKLGKQLKSFTDWLKTMKKVQHGKLPAGNANIDLAVQNLAEKSNKEEQVLTEAMAEVYIQQGKSDKAHDIYKKLSLLNPAKSAYFAAKIELLKVD